MGLLFVDKTADFSVNPLGHAGLYTSLTSGLLALFETRRSASKAINNSAPGGASASVSGSPTFSAGSAAVSFGNALDFKSLPAGSHTIAIVAATTLGGTANDISTGSYSPAANTTGYAYFQNYARRVGLFTSSFATGSVAPLSGNVDKSVYIDFTTSQPELLFGIMESNVSLRLYHPRLGTLATLATVGRDFVFSAPPSYRNTPFNGSGALHDHALFAQWSRVLTPAEMLTFYAEMQPQLAKSGVVI